jgi:hypothetical protein
MNEHIVLSDLFSVLVHSVYISVRGMPVQHEHHATTSAITGSMPSAAAAATSTKRCLAQQHLQHPLLFQCHHLLLQ